MRFLSLSTSLSLMSPNSAPIVQLFDRSSSGGRYELWTTVILAWPEMRSVEWMVRDVAAYKVPECAPVTRRYST